MYWHTKWEEEDRAYWRMWLTITNRFGIDIDANMLDFKRPSCGVSVGRGSRSLKLHFSIPYLISFWIKFKGVLWQGRARELAVRVHGGSVWFNLWTDPMDGRSHCWHVTDWVFGRAVCSTRELEKREVVIPMPEKSYAATAKLMEYTWSYPRWFATVMKRVEIEVPEGIPHEGKGENSWDCGVDATYGITTGPCRSIAEGVGMLVGMCLNDRVRYGGWDDWNWQKPGVATA